MFDKMPIVVKLNKLIINGVYFGKNCKCLHFKKLNTHKLISKLCFA